MIKDIIKERIKKLKELEKKGVNPYPERSLREYSIEEALKNFSAWARKRKVIVLAGRIIAKRGHGGVIFCDIKDESFKIQLVLKEDELGENLIDFFEKYFDIGDFIEAKGYLFTTQRGEKSLLVKTYSLLSKSLRPLPKAWYGLEDIEERYRKRYLDLILNKEVKERFILRSQIINLIREFLNKKGYLEVETPVLQTVYGGANARPFITELEALKTKLYLRIAPELCLKRLIIGGFNKIYEIGKNFRNEGIDREHNPEFTMLELYAAYHTSRDLQKLTEELLFYITKKINKTTERNIVLPKKFKEIDYEEYLFRKTGLKLNDSDDKWLKKAKELKIELTGKETKEKIWDGVFKKFRIELEEPCFIVNQPVEISPLAKRLENQSHKVSRFQFIWKGWEIVNAFSELNNPIEQKERFENQLKMRKRGDLEAHPQDKEFIEALEYGMPPTAGLGIGIDRLVAVLTGAPSLKEVIFFPFMKSRK
ncbi:MAG: lysine--tRNA ligase [Minisyncoccia bacterium]